MKKALYVLTVISIMMFMANDTQAQRKKNKNKAATETTNLKTFQDSVSYAYGFLIGKQMKEMGEVNHEVVKIGLDDQFSNKPILTESEAQDLMTQSRLRKEEMERKKQEEVGAANIAKNKEFLAANIKKKGVKATTSGLQYKVLKPASGARPVAKNKVKVHYEGRLLDGTVFDSSYKRGKAATFGLNQVIKGWTEGLQLMETGAKYQFYIPAALAYGVRGQRGIPSNSLLIFDVELLEIVK